MDAPPRSPSSTLVPVAVLLAAPAAAYGAVQGWRNLDPLDIRGDVGGLAALSFASLAPLLCLVAAFRARREPLHVGAAARLAFAAAVLTWLAFLATTRGFHRVRVEIAVSAGLGAWSGSLLWLGRRGGRIQLALFSLCLLPFLAEVGLRVLARIAPSPLWTRTLTGVDAQLATVAVPPGAIHFGFPCNSRGFYDEEFRPPEGRGRRTIAVIGDSFNVAFVPHPLHYTTVCERALGDVDLLNIGWPSIGPDEYLRLLEREALPLRPNGVVLSLFLGNDLANVRPWNAVDLLLADWFDRGNVLLFEVPRRLGILRRGDARAARPPPASGRLASLEELRREVPWIEDWRREPATMSEAEHLRIETERAGVFGRVGEGSGSLPARRWEALTRRFLEIRDRAAPLPFGVMLIPDEAMVEDALWARVLDASPGARLERHALRERLVAFCAASGVPCLDTWPLLRAVPPEADGDRHLYRLRDTHWNARGNEVAGKALAPFVRALLR